MVRAPARSRHASTPARHPGERQVSSVVRAQQPGTGVAVHVGSRSCSPEDIGSVRRIGRDVAYVAPAPRRPGAPAPKVCRRAALGAGGTRSHGPLRRLRRVRTYSRRETATALASAPRTDDNRLKRIAALPAWTAAAGRPAHHHRGTPGHHRQRVNRGWPCQRQLTRPTRVSQPCRRWTCRTSPPARGWSRLRPGRARQQTPPASTR